MDPKELFSGFRVASTLSERGMVVQIAGHSSSTADQGAMLQAELLRICAASPKLLVLDLSELVEINSAVLGALLLSLRLTAAYGGRLRLAGASPVVLNVLKRSSLIPLFECWPDRESALAGE